MLKLYYTTTKGEGEFQLKFYNSLGGYKSANLVKNDSLDNFFGELSNYTLSNNNENQYIGLILSNEGGAKANILVHFSRNEDCYTKLFLAAVDLVEDAEGKKMMENIPTPTSTPVYADFYEAEGIENAVSLGNLGAGESIGLWFKREILLDVIALDQADIVSPDPENKYVFQAKQLSKEDVIDIVFSYD